MEIDTTQGASPRELMLMQMNESLRTQRNAALDASTQHEARGTLQGELIKSQQNLIAELNARVKDLEAAIAASSPETTN